MARLGAGTGGHQRPLCPWGHSAAPCLGGSGAPTLAKLLACNSDSTLLYRDLRKLGDTAPSLFNFGQGLLLKFPHSLNHHTPAAFPAGQEQELTAFPARYPWGTTGMKGARTEIKTQMPTCALAGHRPTES